MKSCRELPTKYLFNTFCSTIFILLSAIFLFACTVLPDRVSGSILISERYGFSLDIPDGDFEAKYTKDIPLIFINPETGATITVTISDDRYRGEVETDMALQYIAKNLFIYVKEKEYLESRKASLGGVDAWYLKLSGEVNEVPLIFSTYVARHNKKIYDVTLFSSPDDFESSYVIFYEIVNSFKFKDEMSK